MDPAWTGDELAAAAARALALDRAPDVGSGAGAPRSLTCGGVPLAAEAPRRATPRSRAPRPPAAGARTENAAARRRRPRGASRSARAATRGVVGVAGGAPKLWLQRLA